MNIKKKTIIGALLMSFFLFSNCIKWKPVDAKDQPTNAIERAKKNIAEGRGVSVKGLLGNQKGTNYEFSTSNPMWRASLDTLDFIPLSNVDYSGGVIITDWYNDNLNSNDAIKISLQFLSNEIRSDSIKVNIYKRKCNDKNICRVDLTESKIKDELLKSILNKAARLEKTDKIKK